MKIFYLFISFLSLSFASQFAEDFDQKVQKAYSEYLVLEEYTNEYYTIKIVYGLIDNQVRYGVSFYSFQSQDYYLNILYQNNFYTVDRNSRGDVMAVALDIQEGEIFSFAIFNRNDNLQHPFASIGNIQSINKDSFETLENKIVGQGLGSELSILKNQKNLDMFNIVYYVMIAIVLVCVLIIFIFYKMKKGLFAPSAKQNIFDFKAFLTENLPERVREYEEDDENEEEDVETTSQETYGIYEGDKPYNSISNFAWVREEEETSDFNITNHLQNLGFVIDYQVASNEEKNQIMLELMKLRDNGTITRDDYLDEITKLWKNK